MATTSGVPLAEPSRQCRLVMEHLRHGFQVDGAVRGAAPKEGVTGSGCQLLKRSGARSPRRAQCVICPLEGLLIPVRIAPGERPVFGLF